MLEEMGKRARQAARLLAKNTTQAKNTALLRIADCLEDDQEAILAANQIDLANGREKGLSKALLDRLMLNPARLNGMAAGLRAMAELNDPVGQRFGEQTLPNGLKVHKQRVPIGVLAVIYESRPNVTVDVTGLAIKTGNAVILRGGSETIHSNRALVKAIQQALTGSSIPVDAVQFIDSTDRALVTQLLKQHRYVDMLIPRGGAALHDYCRENSTIPVITGGIGICHLFVDESADLEAALPVVRNAKIQRPSVCNALDTVLVHARVAQAFIPGMISALGQDGVQFRMDASAQGYIPENGNEFAQLAGPDDFDTEWLSLVLGVKVVGSLDEAIQHIAAHSTAHSDGILTADQANAERFISEVDSAAVYVNASTRFTDGEQFGLGAEVAVSTQRLHARGPMGLPELTTYKWVVEGDYHARP
jgi:glutamate-5-semialdehyde dehydrogenase